ncbi:hypothetical protein E4U54_003725, partial [Claviceps lovelessii]
MSRETSGVRSAAEARILRSSKGGTSGGSQDWVAPPFGKFSSSNLASTIANKLSRKQTLISCRLASSTTPIVRRNPYSSFFSTRNWTKPLVWQTCQRPSPLPCLLPMAADETPSVAVPGQILGPSSKYLAGPGTHMYEGNVASSLLGKVTITPPAKRAGPAKRLNKITAPAPEERATISVARHGRKREILPDVNNVVLARVVRLMPKQAIVVIQQVGETVLQTEWQGVIRVQDVRATEKDKVKIHESFKPGDI